MRAEILYDCIGLYIPIVYVSFQFLILFIYYIMGRREKKREKKIEMVQEGEKKRNPLKEKSKTRCCARLCRIGCKGSLRFGLFMIKKGIRYSLRLFNCACSALCCIASCI